MRSRVYVTLWCPSVRPSVRPSVPLSVCPSMGRVSALTQTTGRHCSNRAAAARGSSTALSIKCGQCHVYSQGTRLNTDLLHCVYTLQPVVQHVVKHGWLEQNYGCFSAFGLAEK